MYAARKTHTRSFCGVPDALPGTDKFDLFVRFRGLGMDAALGHALPPFCQLLESSIAAFAMPHQITADNGSRSTDPAPAMQVYSSTRPQRLIDLIENGLHQLRRRQPKIANGEAMMLHIQAIGLALFLKDSQIGGCFVWPGEIDKGVEACLDQCVDACTRVFLVKLTRVFAG